MSRSTILIVYFQNRRAEADDLRQRLQAQWPESDSPPPILEIVDADQWPHDEPTPDAIIAIVDTAEEQTALKSWLKLVHASRHAVIIRTTGAAILSEAPTVGLTVAARTGEGELLAALRGVLHCSRTLRELQKELSLVERFHGGLESQLSNMHEELQLAAMVQREFLPTKLPFVHGVDFGAMWRPANYVSGDIYDVMQLDEDHVGVFIADAVGHGVPAALMTMVIVRSLMTREDHNPAGRLLSPAEVMRRLNEQLISRRDGSTRFATGAYALVDCRSRTLRIAGAGHPPPLHFKHAGDVVPLETEGGLLGIFQDESYSEREVELEIGDRVLFYSDGFEVAFPKIHADNYEQRLPTARYIDEFRDMFAQESTEKMLDHIQHRIDAQRGSLHQVDDLTMVCMHAGPLDASQPIVAETDARHHGTDNAVLAGNG